MANRVTRSTLILNGFLAERGHRDDHYGFHREAPGPAEVGLPEQGDSGPGNASVSTE
jgi:hypothetical protein